MPRGRKKKPESVEEQMQLVQAEIDELSAKLKAKKKEMAVLERRKRLRNSRSFWMQLQHPVKAWMKSSECFSN